MEIAVGWVKWLDRWSDSGGMVALTRLNGDRFVLNAELIRTVEAAPDTVIKLVSGETMMVREGVEEVVEAAVEYGQLLRGLVARS